MFTPYMYFHMLDMKLFFILDCVASGISRAIAFVCKWSREGISEESSWFSFFLISASTREFRIGWDWEKGDQMLCRVKQKESFEFTKYPRIILVL